MKSIETCLPRPVVMHFFVQPNQRMVRWNYSSIRDAKKVWHPTRLVNAANEKLQPWTSYAEWHYTKEPGGARRVHKLVPTSKPVLRYQGGDLVPSAHIGPTKRYKRRRNRKYKEERPSQHSAGRRLREQQTLDHAEPHIRAGLRVHPLYYEDAWSVRETERNWKAHRKNQWRT